MGWVEPPLYMEMIKQPTQHGVNPYPPEAELRLYSGVPWDNTYQHCRLYSSQSALLSALEKWRVKPSDQLRSMSPIRIGSHQIRVPFTEVKALSINYFAFCNHMYSEKWVFGFVTGFEWLSTHATTLTLEYDVFQNSIYYATIRPCMVEWEHIPRSEDSNTVCRTAVNMDVGRMTCYSTRNIEFQFDNLCAYVTEGTTGKDFEPSIVNHMLNSCAFWRTSLLNESEGLKKWEKFIKDYEDNPDAIISVFQCPDICTPQAIKNNKNSIQISIPYNLEQPFGGYKPKNKKLYSYPFISCVADNNNGTATEFYFEDSDNGKTLKFRSEGALATMPQVITFPVNYCGVRHNYSKAIINQAYSLCGWNSDVFKAWQAQNKSQIGLATFSNDLSAFVGGVSGAFSGYQSGSEKGGTALGIAGAVKGGLEGAYGGIYRDAQLSAQKEDMQRIPPQTRGKALSDSINVGVRLNGVFFYLMCCRKEYAMKADSFFEKYGYPINRIKTPRYKTRSSWNYIKTSNCNFKGAIELNHLNALRAIFDNGVTIWHTDDVGNYNLPNN